ncbi:MAG: hypothetical protein JHC41_00335 [Nitrosopumilus sp.]|nr:hypothetical protein [Nitrosopumilus sp.]
MSPILKGIIAGKGTTPVLPGSTTKPVPVQPPPVPPEPVKPATVHPTQDITKK